VSATYWFAVLVVPAAMVVAGRRLADRALLALAATCAVTWGATTAVITWLLTDPSDIAGVVIFYFLVAPSVGTLLAALVATRVVRIRGRFLPSFLLAFLGWVFGLGGGMIIYSTAGFDELWDNAILLALPAIYAACGAVLAASIRED
jgi:hypothetical protein